MSSRLAQIRDGKAVVSENGDVQIEKISFGWQHRGEYELRVPKSKQRGGIYTMHPDLLKLVENRNFITKGNNMVAYVTEENIAKVVDMLSRTLFNLTVLQESQLSEVSKNEAEEDDLFRTNDQANDKISANDLAKLGAADRQAVIGYLDKMPSAPISVISNAEDIESQVDLSKEAKMELSELLSDSDTLAGYCRESKKSIYL